MSTPVEQGICLAVPGDDPRWRSAYQKYAQILLKDHVLEFLVDGWKAMYALEPEEIKAAGQKLIVDFIDGDGKLFLSSSSRITYKERDAIEALILDLCSSEKSLREYAESKSRSGHYFGLPDNHN